MSLSSIRTYGWFPGGSQKTSISSIRTYGWLFDGSQGPFPFSVFFNVPVELLSDQTTIVANRLLPVEILGSNLINHNIPIEIFGAEQFWFLDSRGLSWLIEDRGVLWTRSYSQVLWNLRERD